MNAPKTERSPETLPNLSGPEITPDIPAPSPERGADTAERASEHANAAQAATAAQPAPISLPTPVPVQADDAQTAVSDDNPAVAADEDLIEKEWVDKAKQIISQTHDDPARREKEVGRLQADYLKKRYGKELGASPE